MDVLVLYHNGVTTSMALEERHFQAIQKAAGGCVYVCEDEETAIRNRIDADILVLWGGTGAVPEAWCSASRRLKWAHTLSAGYDPVERSCLWQLPVHLTNTRGIHGKTIALTVLGYVIALLRRFPGFYRCQTDHVWERPLRALPQEAEGRTACIVGAGAVGCEIAASLKSIGMRVIGVKRRPAALQDFDEVVGVGCLRAVIPAADFLILAVPLTGETYHMIDGAVLSGMKPGAFLINVSRGSVVDEAALTAALQAKRLGGAVMDVAEQEPLAADSPLWDLENVIITPHMSAVSDCYMDRAVGQLCENLCRFRDGKPLLNEIKNNKGDELWKTS